VTPVECIGLILKQCYSVASYTSMDRPPNPGYTGIGLGACIPYPCLNDRRLIGHEANSR